MENLKAHNFSKPQLAVFVLAFGLIGFILLKSFAAPNPALPGDLNNDNIVNITDMSILLSNYGTSNSTADINTDGTVNILDMSILLSHYGQTVSALSKPSIPTGLTATAGNGSVALRWNLNPAAENVDVYQVYVNGANTNLAVTGTSYTVNGLANGTSYDFRISAHNSAGYGDWTTIISATPQGTTGGGGTIGSPIWSGDFETGNLSQWGGWEYGGTFDGTPPLNQRSTVGTNIDGFSPLQGSYFNKITVAPGDAYGTATGWRTLSRQYEPIKPINAGYDSWFVWGMLLPNGYPGDANMWQTGPEMHQSKAPYVSVTGVAPFHFIATGTYMHVDVAGGRDGARTVYIDQNFLNGYAHNTWYVFAMHYKHGLTPNGAFDFYYAKKGDAAMTKLVSMSGIGTMYEQTYNYLLFGIYRAQTGTSTTTAYFDGMKEFASGTDALNYASSLL